MQLENETIYYYITIGPLFALGDRSIIDNLRVSIRDRYLKTRGHQPTTPFRFRQLDFGQQTVARGRKHQLTGGTR